MNEMRVCVREWVGLDNGRRERQKGYGEWRVGKSVLLIPCVFEHMHNNGPPVAHYTVTHARACSLDLLMNVPSSYG
jgi:hypothetical protein